ncbi:MAG: hypothetical protein PVH77_07610 [Phycisphaerales bacterium]|jgi:hypothetical protein
MHSLSEPKEDLVFRIISEVQFEERLTGYRMRERAGAIRASMYSFEEVVHLLNDQFPYVNLKTLEKWIKEIIGDEELAETIAEVTEQENNDRDKLSRVRALMGERLCQCKKAVHSG